MTVSKFYRLAFMLLLGLTTSYFIGNAPSKIFRTQTKPVEITKEATSTSAFVSLQGERSTVKRIIDGDTIELVDGRKVRYIGINTPETVDPRRPVECFGKEASEENKRLVDGKTVRLEKDVSQTDTYGRLLRYVYVSSSSGELFVNDHLVRNGFAYVSTYPPDVKYVEQFRQAQTEAQQSRRGHWSGCPLYK